MATIRLADDVNARMKAAATKAGVSTTKLIEQACTQFLDGPPPAAARTRTAAAGLIAEDDCPHPRNKRKTFAWGAVCGDCGKLNP